MDESQFQQSPYTNYEIEVALKKAKGQGMTEGGFLGFIAACLFMYFCGP